MKAKYMNLIHGIKLVRVDENGKSADFAVSENLARFFMDNRKNALPLKKSEAKAAGLGQVDAEIERLYYALIPVVCKERPEGNEITNVIKRISVLFEACGCGSTVYAGHYEFIMACMSVQAIGGKNAFAGNMKTTSFPAFRKAFYNGLFNLNRGQNIARETVAQEKGRAAMEARAKRAAKK